MPSKRKPAVRTTLTVNTTIQTPMGPVYIRFPLLKFVLDLLGGK